MGKILITRGQVSDAVLDRGVNGESCSLQWLGRIELEFVSSGKMPLNREELIKGIEDHLSQLEELKSFNIF